MIPNQEMHRIATTAIIFRSDNRVLILERAPHKKVWPGKWTVPGGGLQTDDYTTRHPTHIGETNQWYGVVKNSIFREVFEETGLSISNPWLVCDLAFIRPDGVPVLVLSYAAELIETEFCKVTLDENSTNYHWVNLEEAKEFDLIDGIYHELKIAFFKRENS